MNFDYPARVRAGMILLILISLLSGRELLRISRVSRAGAEANEYLRRFDAVKKALPHRGVVCYAPDPHSDGNAVKGYFLAQYALAPVVLRTAADCDFLVADFPTGSAYDASGSEYLPVKDFGSGVTLFRKRR